MIEGLLVVLRWAGVVLASVASVAYVRGLAAPAGSSTATASTSRFVLGAVLCFTGALLVRGFQLGTVPLVTSYEALLFYAWLLLVVFLALVRPEEHRTMGAYLVPLATILALYGAAFMAPPAAVSTLFHNPMFVLFRVSVFLGYSALSVAFCAGVMYLLLFDEIAHKKVGRMFARLPSLDDLDRLGHRTVLFGSLLLTAAIVAGMVWARVEWDVLYVWEPMGVWTLLSWAGCLLYLGTRAWAGWQGQRAAWLAAVGFALSAGTFLGANLLLGSGRHLF